MSSALHQGGDNPRTALTTPRLILREMTRDDLDDMAALLGDPQVMRYYPAPKSETKHRRGSTGISGSIASADSGSGW